ncbi:MAG: ABC transporter permease [Alistipes sp.]|nr:ABC transporter permease [Alistipes sp.]
MQWTFARRYLLSRSSHSVINIIAVVSIVAVAIPVAAMVILLSVFNGFESLVRTMYADIDADIEIRSTEVASASEIMLPSDSSAEQILTTEGVESLSFVIERQALAVRGERQSIVTVRGADDNYFEVLPPSPQSIQGGQRLTLGEVEYALPSEDVAQLLGIYTHVGASLSLHSLGGGQVGSLMPLRGVRSHEIEVGGIVRGSNMLKTTVMVPLRVAQQLFGREHATAIYLRIADGYRAEQVAGHLAESLGESVEVRTREQKNSIFYNVMRYEKWAVFFVSLMVLLIASLSIIGTVVMLIVEKRDEYPTLLAIGADNAFIRGIFIREGLLISAIGGFAGLGLGIAITLLQQWLHIVRMPQGNFVIDYYPVELHSGDVILIFITFIAIAWLISTIAAGTMIKPRKICTKG